MTFNQLPAHGGLLLASLVLLGCPGGDTNTTSEGIKAHLAEVHAETPPGGTPLEVTGVSSSPTMTGGYAQDQLEHHTIRDQHGQLLSLYRAYLVLDELELVPCPGLSRLPDLLLNALARKAHAHAGHGSEPVGGRALDKPNVIDIVTQDEFSLPLGDVALAPGRYCGLRVALVRMAGDAYGTPAYAAASTDDPTSLPEIPDLAGHMFALRADYCAQTDAGGLCTQRVKVDIDDGGLSEPPVLTLDFAQPLELNAVLREGYVAVGIAYGEWVQGVDIRHLANDPAEVQKLLNNMVASLYIYSRGWGGLPVNLAP
jgi:hypothetical protein